jgi:hypothetical protein
MHDIALSASSIYLDRISPECENSQSFYSGDNHEENPYVIILILAVAFFLLNSRLG